MAAHICNLPVHFTQVGTYFSSLLFLFAVEKTKGSGREEETGEATEKGGNKSAQRHEEERDPRQTGQVEKNYRQRGHGTQVKLYFYVPY